MISPIIIATEKGNNLKSFADYLENKLCNKVECLSDFGLIVNTIKKQSSSIIIKDYALNFNSIKLVQKVIEINAFANIAILSNDTANKFEDKFEGFGVLIQLSDPPSNSEAERLCKKISKIKVLYNSV